MFCNKVLLAFAALIAVTAAAVPYFPIFNSEGELIETEPMQFANPLNEKPKQHREYKWGEWGNPAQQQGGSDVESQVESEVEEVEEADDVDEVEAYDQAAGVVPVPPAGGDSSAEAGAGAGAMGAGNANGAAAGTGAAAPVVAESHHIAGETDVYAAAGPAPGQLKATSSSGQGLGIAVGVCSLVVATTAVAVFAIRKYWRHRL